MANMMDPTADYMNREDIHNFFRNLWLILNDTEFQYFDVVKWINNGASFKIEDEEKFYKEVCPLIWKGCTREYFQYVLWACNFKSVPSGSLEIRNCDFVEDNYQRLKNIKPKKPVLTLRVFLKLNKNSSTEEKSVPEISSTSGESFSLGAGVSEQGNTVENSNQQLSSSGKASQLKGRASALENIDRNSNKFSSSRKVPLIIARSYALKHIHENSNPLSSRSGKVPPLKTRSSELKNTIENSNKQLKDFSCIEVSAQINTDKNSEIQIISPQNTYEKSNKQLGSTSEKDISLQVEESSVQKNTDKNSNLQKSFTSEKDTTSDAGASVSDELLKQPSVKNPTIASISAFDPENMRQEDIYCFFKRLWDIISDSEYQYFSVVRWIESGKIFRIVDLAKFQKEVCPLLCEGCTFDYFKYVLFACGFESFPNDFLNFGHRDFLEDDFEKLKKIRSMSDSLSTPRAFFKS